MKRDVDNESDRDQWVWDTMGADDRREDLRQKALAVMEAGGVGPDSPRIRRPSPAYFMGTRAQDPSFRFAHRAKAALRAIAERCSGKGHRRRLV